MGPEQGKQPAEAGRRGCKHRQTLRPFRRKAAQPLKLDQYLKWSGLVATGGEAKLRIQRGDVRVNGAIEPRRGRQLHIGDVVTIDGRELLVTPQSGGRTNA